MTTSTSTASPLLEADGLTRRFGGLKAVNNVSVNLYVGEVHAVIGTNGAGKSTLINMLSGEIAPTDGSIKLNGKDVTTLSQPKRARSGIGRSYQRTTIFPEFTVLENCRMAAQAALPRPWAVWEPASRCNTALRIARSALEAAGLSDQTEVHAGSMSHGKKRQLEIAMCLATMPKVLLLDEPLAGMGAEETERMLSMLGNLKRTHAVLLVEHDMDAVFRIADRITVMVNGEVIASDVPQAIRTNPDVQVAYLGDH
ncbi:ABC transporter ATP-binding protein [Noviherbaspirillum saxi]|uniref:ABC transporter ATP-binding protein n=1 Tax=Noviherbaspirillum saxi TaxID=2320863 RepID=A0A3A3FM92_9BURK|nr:ABC transporter ATP-binding protein [Noviherbaspirillum saxi]RJF95605.1 ABC transporter ATP-binding protein [Noviherbaspirillum saxi]